MATSRITHLHIKPDGYRATQVDFGTYYGQRQLLARKRTRDHVWDSVRLVLQSAKDMNNF